MKLINSPLSKMKSLTNKVLGQYKIGNAKESNQQKEMYKASNQNTFVSSGLKSINKTMVFNRMKTENKVKKKNTLSIMEMITHKHPEFLDDNEEEEDKKVDKEQLVEEDKRLKELLQLNRLRNQTLMDKPDFIPEFITDINNILNKDKRKSVLQHDSKRLSDVLNLSNSAKKERLSFKKGNTKNSKNKKNSLVKEHDQKAKTKDKYFKKGINKTNSSISKENNSPQRNNKRLKSKKNKSVKFNYSSVFLNDLNNNSEIDKKETRKSEKFTENKTVADNEFNLKLSILEEKEKERRMEEDNKKKESNEKQKINSKKSEKSNLESNASKHGDNNTFDEKRNKMHTRALNSSKSKKKLKTGNLLSINNLLANEKKGKLHTKTNFVYSSVNLVNELMKKDNSKQHFTEEKENIIRQIRESDPILAKKIIHFDKQKTSTVLYEMEKEKDNSIRIVTDNLKSKRSINNNSKLHSSKSLIKNDTNQKTEKSIGTLFNSSNSLAKKELNNTELEHASPRRKSKHSKLNDDEKSKSEIAQRECYSSEHSSENYQRSKTRSAKNNVVIVPKPKLSPTNDSYSLINNFTNQNLFLLKDNLEFDVPKEFTAVAEIGNSEDEDESFVSKNKADENARVLLKYNKVYDSLSDVEDDEIAKIKEDKYLIYDDTTFKIIWNYLILIVSLYSTLMIPITYAFASYYNSPFLAIIDVIIDLCMGIDLLMNFFVPYYSFDEVLVKNIKLIAINYLKGWFIIDFLAAFPVSTIYSLIYFPKLGSFLPQQIITAYVGQLKTIELIGYLNIMKILSGIRILKVKKETSKFRDGEVFEDSGLHTLYHLLKFYFWFYIATHITSCIWVLIGFYQPNNNWIILNNLQDNDAFSIYIASLYYHWTTIFTIGYGDIITKSIIERLYTSFLMLIGIAVYSYTLSTMGALLNKQDAFTKKYNTNIDLLNDLKFQYKLDDTFYAKVRKYILYDYQHNTSERYKFVEELPKNVMKDLLLNMHRSIIGSLHFLQNCKNEEFITRVVLSMRPVRVQRKEKLFDENEVIEEMYFVRRGILSLCLGEEYDNIKIMEIRKNEHFGDIFCLASQRTPYQLKVSSRYSDLLIIRKQDLISISEDFSESFEQIFNVSRYNHYVMLELTELKKQKILEVKKIEKRKQKIKQKQEYIMKQTILNTRKNRRKKQVKIQLKKPKEGKADDVSSSALSNTKMVLQCQSPSPERSQGNFSSSSSLDQIKNNVNNEYLNFINYLSDSNTEKTQVSKKKLQNKEYLDDDIDKISEEDEEFNNDIDEDLNVFKFKHRSTFMRSFNYSDKQADVKRKNSSNPKIRTFASEKRSNQKISSFVHSPPIKQSESSKKDIIINAPVVPRKKESSTTALNDLFINDIFKLPNKKQMEKIRKSVIIKDVDQFKSRLLEKAKMQPNFGKRKAKSLRRKSTVHKRTSPKTRKLIIQENTKEKKEIIEKVLIDPGGGTRPPSNKNDLSNINTINNNQHQATRLIHTNSNGLILTHNSSIPSQTQATNNNQRNATNFDNGQTHLLSTQMQNGIDFIQTNQVNTSNQNTINQSNQNTHSNHVNRFAERNSVQINMDLFKSIENNYNYEHRKNLQRKSVFINSPAFFQINKLGDSHVNFNYNGILNSDNITGNTINDITIKKKKSSKKHNNTNGTLIDNNNLNSSSNFHMSNNKVLNNNFRINNNSCSKNCKSSSKNKNRNKLEQFYSPNVKIRKLSRIKSELFNLSEATENNNKENQKSNIKQEMEFSDAFKTASNKLFQNIQNNLATHNGISNLLNSQTQDLRTQYNLQSSKKFYNDVSNTLLLNLKEKARKSMLILNHGSFHDKISKNDLNYPREGSMNNNLCKTKKKESKKKSLHKINEFEQVNEQAESNSDSIISEVEKQKDTQMFSLPTKIELLCNLKNIVTQSSFFLTKDKCNTVKSLQHKNKISNKSVNNYQRSKTKFNPTKKEYSLNSYRSINLSKGKSLSVFKDNFLNSNHLDEIQEVIPREEIKNCFSSTKININKISNILSLGYEQQHNAMNSNKNEFTKLNLKENNTMNPLKNNCFGKENTNDVPLMKPKESLFDFSSKQSSDLINYENSNSKESSDKLHFSKPKHQNSNLIESDQFESKEAKEIQENNNFRKKNISYQVSKKSGNIDKCTNNINNKFSSTSVNSDMSFVKLIKSFYSVAKMSKKGKEFIKKLKSKEN